MATTRIMPLHIGKGRTESRAISEIIDYVANPQKTDHGRLITGYECDSRVADRRVYVGQAPVYRRHRAGPGRGRCDRLPCPPVLLPWGDHPGGSQPAGCGVCKAVHQRQTRLYRLYGVSVFRCLNLRVLWEPHDAENEPGQGQGISLLLLPHREKAWLHQPGNAQGKRSCRVRQGQSERLH